MKKSLLTLTMFIACVFAAMAQQDGKTWETAFDIVEGVNSSEDLTTVKTFYSGAYFKYSATENTIITVNGIVCGGLYFYDEDHESLDSSYSGIGSTYYYSVEVEAGKTVFLIAHLNYGDGGTMVSFNAQIDKGDTLHGNTSDDPRTIEDGNTYWFKGNYNAYMTYNATEDGVLELGYNGSDYGSTCIVDGVTTNLTYDNGEHVLRIPVKAGKTYDIHVYCSRYSMFSVSVTLTHPQQGDTMDNPLEMTLGENAIPAAAGKYWYSFTNGATPGFVTFNAPGATISVRHAGYSYDDIASSMADMAKVEVAGNATVLVAVVKSAAEPTTITASFSEPTIGEIESNPIALTSDADAVVEVPAGSTLFYTISTEDASCFLNAKVVSGWNDNSSCQVKTTADTYYQYSFTGSSPLHLQAAKNTTCILKITNAGTEVLGFSVWAEEIAKGDFITDPIIAAKGENTILPVGATDKYFSYTPETSCRLDITVPEGVEVKFPYMSWGYEYYNDPAKVEGNTYSYFVTAGSELIFKLIGTQPRMKFTIEEATAGPGESRGTALEYTEPYALQNMPGTVWLVYNAQTDGVLNIKADLNQPGYYDCVYYYVNDETTQHSIAKFDYNTYAYTYDDNVPVTAGDKVYVKVIMKTDQTGSVITMTLREPAAGESPSKPIVLTPDVETEVGTVAWGGTPSWYCFTAVQAGTVKFVASDYMSMNICKPEDPSTNLLDSDASFGGSYYGDFEYEGAEAGTYLVKVTYTYGVTLTVSGSAFEGTTTSIDSINTENDVKMYNLAGQRITSTGSATGYKGIVIVNGKKMLVK